MEIHQKKIDPSLPTFRGHSKSLESTRIDRLPITFYYWSIVTKGLCRTISQTNGDFGWKLQIFPTAVLLTPALREFPFEFCNGVSIQKNWVTSLWGEKDSFRYTIGAICPACVSRFLSNPAADAYDQLHAATSSSQPQKQSATALVASSLQDQLRGTRCRHHYVMTNCLSLHFAVCSRLNSLPEHTTLL